MWRLQTPVRNRKKCPYCLFRNTEMWLILYDVVVSVWSLDRSLGARVAGNLIGLSASLNPLQILLTQTQRSRVRFPGTAWDFSEGVESWTGSTQPRDRINWVITWIKKQRCGLESWKMQLWDSMCWPHVAKDCQRRLLSRPRFVRAVAPRSIITCAGTLDHRGLSAVSCIGTGIWIVQATLDYRE
jgi:hypothetical protein